MPHVLKLIKNAYSIMFLMLKFTDLMVYNLLVNATYAEKMQSWLTAETDHNSPVTIRHIANINMGDQW